MLKNDIWIAEQAKQGMITPFVEDSIREIELPDNTAAPALSFGLSSYGYDLRLSPKEFFIFRKVPGTVINPKNFDPKQNLEKVELQTDVWGSYFIIPANSYGLGVALEKLAIPENITCLFIGKSTYARVGLIANCTPGEACMSEDTEILSESGWKLLKDVIIGERVLTLNPETQKAEYHPVQDRQRYYFNGDLLRFHSKYVDQLVTPQHRMWAGKRSFGVVPAGSDGRATKQIGVERERFNSWRWNIIRAQDLFGKWNHYLSRDVNWDGSACFEETFKIGKYSMPISVWCKFLGAWMGDGSAYIAERGNYVVKLAVVTKEVKREYFRGILEQMGVNFFEHERGFDFRDKEVCHFLQPYKGAKNKHLPKAIKQFPPTLLLSVIEGMMMSDGNLASSTFCSSSKKLINDFQEICLKAGYNATCWERTVLSNLTGTVSTQYKCRYSPRNSTPNKLVPDKNMSKVPYTGMVYDVTVKNHIFLSRRNGRASWTGNCWKGHLTLEFSNSSSTDCRIYANEGVVQTLFFEGDPCATTYDDRHGIGGKYQNQPHSVITSKV